MTEPSSNRTQHNESDERIARKAYDAALDACGREAAATLAAAFVLLFFFWGAVFLMKDSTATVFGMPLWFAAAVPGGFLLSVLAALVLARLVDRGPAFDAAEGAEESLDQCEVRS